MKRRIFFVTNNLAMMRVFRYEMLAALSKVYELTIVSPDDVKEKEWVQKLGIHFIDCPVDRRGTNPIKDAALFLRYLRVLNKEKPDGVVSFTIKPNIYAGLACQFLSIPFIATVEGLGSGWAKGGALTRLVKFLYATGLKKANTVFVLNEWIYQELEKIGVAKPVMKFLPGMGVNLSHFVAYDYPAEPPFKLLTIGRVMREKGFPQLIGAAKILQEKLPNLEWHVVGAAEVKELDLIEAIKTLKNVIYHGPQTDVRPFYAMCHATTTTTYHEGMSTVCLEAAASARPVLGTNTFGVKETFIEGETGFGIEKRSVADTVRVIENFFQLPHEKREAMGKAGRRYMEEHFDRNKVTWSYFTVLQSVYAKDSPEALDLALQSIAESTGLPSEVVLVKDDTLPVFLERALKKWERTFS